MVIKSLKLAYFSPTGTTKLITQAIVKGIPQNSIEQIDLTKQVERMKFLQTSENELLVVAVPVYVGRVPALLRNWLQEIKANKTPVVCVVVFGNREFDDALLELKSILERSGGKPIACAAFIGEHSYSSQETPIAEARPDARDLSIAKIFGHKINDRLLSISSTIDIPDIKLPGNYPYRGDTKLWVVDFINIGDECTLCGNCAEVCPVSAIDPENVSLIDEKKCITCCACIKICPQSARKMKASPVKDAAIRLCKSLKERKEPILFF